MRYFDEINIFADNQKRLRNCFIFFFCIALCGYISIMFSQNPYSDDFCRYLLNSPVGMLPSGRYITRFIEGFLYGSIVITDVAPFSYVVSCFFLAYITIICLKIFRIDLHNKWHILCFIPVTVNPFLLSIMLFRFDNPFTTLALLITILAAYLSSLNEKKYIFAQIILLLIPLMMYQAAVSAYITIFAYLFIENISSGKDVKITIYQMRGWFYTIIITFICYIPFSCSLTYFLSKYNKRIFIIPDSL